MNILDKHKNLMRKSGDTELLYFFCFYMVFIERQILTIYFVS